ncbi:hypothetical protein BJ508DRAFT_320051 [Ascobolus immersus RN42]|uniref:Uncharacterized protein n=1 Tax=Ascobolus immersus RN42 TaxID=1160509 RepID=A0A3N4IQ67_ASCIM|nr:hypothetical protein BJ508DRAFT_320051 [Ascobolus immersus RN42]
MSPRDFSPQELADKLEALRIRQSALNVQDNKLESPEFDKAVLTSPLSDSIFPHLMRFYHGKTSRLSESAVLDYIDSLGIARVDSCESTWDQINHMLDNSIIQRFEKLNPYFSVSVFPICRMLKQSTTGLHPRPGTARERVELAGRREVELRPRTVKERTVLQQAIKEGRLVKVLFPEVMRDWDLEVRVAWYEDGLQMSKCSSQDACWIRYTSLELESVEMVNLSTRRKYTSFSAC